MLLGVSLDLADMRDKNAYESEQRQAGWIRRQRPGLAEGDLRYYGRDPTEARCRPRRVRFSTG